MPGTAPVLEASGGEIPWRDAVAALLPGRFEWLPGPSLSLAATPPPPSGLYLCRVFATRAYVWPHSVGASSVLSSHPCGYALVRLTFPARLAPAPLPFAAFCPPTLLRAGPGGAPVPPAVRLSQCARVTGWLPCVYRHPQGGESEGATAVSDVPGWCP